MQHAVGHFHNMVFCNYLFSFFCFLVLISVWGACPNRHTTVLSNWSNITRSLLGIGKGVPPSEWCGDLFPHFHDCCLWIDWSLGCWHSPELRRARYHSTVVDKNITPAWTSYTGSRCALRLTQFCFAELQRVHLWNLVDAYKDTCSLSMTFFPSEQEGNSSHEERSDVLVGPWESVGLYCRKGYLFKGWWSGWHLCAVKTALFECDLPAALLKKLLDFLHSLPLAEAVK